ncbi:peptidase M42 [Sulfurimonas sp. HSL1-2]|uniref:peptidase M42 n=1 Tax=Thiomicrolovo zhangzhouensis TaxID=3131933 RepID=UPI0031FA43F3
MTGVAFGEFLDTLKYLVRRPSVVGAEHPFFLTLKRELDELGIETTLYEGVLFARGRRPASGALSAHIDRHGLICTGPNEFQYAAFLTQNRADLSGNSVAEQTMNTISERFAGQAVQAYEPWSGTYLGLGNIEKAYICPRRNNLIFEVKGLEYLMPGTPVAYVDSLRINDGMLSAQLDNVISAALILHLYRSGYEGTAFFTAQEEAGKSWRFVLEWYRRFDGATDRLLVLDTSPFPDRAAADAQDLVLRYRDANAAFNKTFTEEIAGRCDRLGIRYSFKDRYIAAQNAHLASGGTATSLGSTEMGRLAAEGTLQGTTLQLPTTGYHTVSETVRTESVKKMLHLLADLYL